MPSIKLRRGADVWLATFSDPRMIPLFGTNTIPTPFSATTPASTVFKRINELNPNTLVEVLS